MADIIETISQSIPVFFYDVLARLLPGAILLYFVGLPGKPLLSAKLEIADFVVLAVGGYATGILLTVISSLMFDAPLELISHLSPRFRKVSINRLWDQIDHLDVYNERHARLLVKIEAEMTFCQNLFILFFILVMLQYQNSVVQRNILFDLRKPISWLVAGTIFASVIHRTAILFRRVHVLASALPLLERPQNNASGKVQN